MSGQQVTISEKAKAILALCEGKEELQTKAELLNQEAERLLEELKVISLKQKRILEQQIEIDKTIEKIAHTC